MPRGYGFCFRWKLGRAGATAETTIADNSRNPCNGAAMLRITVHDKPPTLRFQLEGELTGPWVRVLEECWRSALKQPRKPTLRVDLTGTTLIDAEGQACLAALHRQGAQFVAADCLTKAIVEEITNGPIAVRGRRTSSLTGGTGT